MDEMPTSTVWTRHSSTFPRMCGGDPYTEDKGDFEIPFSPHTRG